MKTYGVLDRPKVYKYTISKQQSDLAGGEEVQRRVIFLTRLSPNVSLLVPFPVTQPDREVLTDSRLRLTSLALASPLSTETNRALHYL